MNQTTSAYGDFPTVSRKPGPFIGRVADSTTAHGCFKTPDFKHNTVGIGIYMLMGSVDFNTFGLLSNDEKALTATDIFSIIRYFFLGLVFCFINRCSIRSLNRFLTQEYLCFDIIRYHGEYACQLALPQLSGFWVYCHG